MAAALRQHVLPPRGSASLHDPADDERLFKSEGKYTLVQLSLLSHLVASSGLSFLRWLMRAKHNQTAKELWFKRKKKVCCKTMLSLQMCCELSSDAKTQQIQKARKHT